MVFVRRVGQDGVMAAGMEAEDDFAAWEQGEAHALVADGDAAVGADLDRRALAPHIRPPRAGGFGAQHGALFPLRLLPGGAGRAVEFAMDFMLVAVVTQGGDMVVGDGQLRDVFGGEIGREAVLPELNDPFYL